MGYLQYDIITTYSFSPEAIAGIITGALCIIIIFLITLFLYRRKSTQAEREYKRIQIQMDTLESNVRSECKQGIKHILLLYFKLVNMFIITKINYLLFLTIIVFK